MVQPFQYFSNFAGLADWKSAIQQVGNLRYPGNHSRWLALLCSFLPWITQASPTNKPAAFEGTVFAALERPDVITNQFIFTRAAHKLRIENADKALLEPINILDLDSGGLTIIYPHNSSFVRLPPEKPAAAPTALSPTRSAAAPSQGGLPPNLSAASFPPSPGSSVGAQFAPGSLPNLPGVPPGTGSAPPGSGMIPPMPAMPAMPTPPGGFVMGNTELRKIAATNRLILGMDCALYTMTNHFETLAVWAVPDSLLFPFRVLERDYTRRHAATPLVEDQWIEQLQKKSLFPLEATLRVGPVVERFSFKVTAIKPQKTQTESTNLFTVPPGFIEIEPPAP